MYDLRNSSREMLNGLSPAINAESSVGAAVVAAERFLKRTHNKREVLKRTTQPQLSQFVWKDK